MSNKKIKIRLKKRRKPKQTFGKILLRFTKRILALILILILALVGYTAFRFTKINKTALDQTDVNLSVNEGAANMHPGEDVTNIALFGSDEDDGEGNKRCDTIIIMSFNHTDKSVNLTSVMRDTYVYIPDYSYYKINTAYLLGGPELAIKTINSNFDMNIRDFVTFDFSSLIEIVDAVGGIELTLSEAEAVNFNDCLSNINNNYDAAHPSPYKDAGRTLFDGKQALAYTRMRYTGNGDFDRAARQRLVLQSVLTKVLCNFNLAMLYRLPGCLGDNITTSMGSGNLIKTGLDLLKYCGNMHTYSLSRSAYIRSAEIDGLMVLTPYDLSDMARALHESIYSSEYTPTDELNETSRRLKHRLNNYVINRIDTDITI